MSLVEAAEHIQIVEGCDSMEALRQLKSEMGDGTVKIRWKPTKRRPTTSPMESA